jgi:diguanylate cyclase
VTFRNGPARAGSPRRLNRCPQAADPLGVLERIARSRGLARACVAVLTVGLVALALLAFRTNARTATSTERIRTIESITDHWDQVLLLIGVEYEVLADYERSDGSVGRLPLQSALSSATVDLVWLQNSGDRARADAFAASYQAYTESLAGVITSGDDGDIATMKIHAGQAALSASSLRREAVDAASTKRAELAAFLGRVDRENHRARTAAIFLVAVDCSLLAVCGFLLLGYQRRTERQAEESTHRSLHDGLTGLPNRVLFAERLEAAVSETPHFGILLLDLDRFKEVNDTLGHHQGDTLLIEVAARLIASIRRDDTVARLGGDEFAVLLSTMRTQQEALEVAERIQQALRRPVRLDGTTVEIGCSIGVAVHPDHGSDPTELLKNADIAMYGAKRGQSSTTVYSSAADRHSTDQLAMVAQLRQALSSSDQLVLHYQPKVEIATGRLGGVEALVRWRHPTRGLLGPSEFLLAAEENRLIGPLTDHVLSDVLLQMQAWLEEGIRLSVAVNVDAPSLLDVGFPDRVADRLAWARVPADLLTLEITEKAFLSDADSALGGLKRLRALGLRLSMDDFGTGYSAMAHLQTMPLDELKIDRRFITGLITSPKDQAITRAVIDLAHALDLSVVAEGVEDAATLEALGRLDCDLAQGFHLGRPVAASDLRLPAVSR